MNTICRIRGTIAGSSCIAVAAFVIGPVIASVIEPAASRIRVSTMNETACSDADAAAGSKIARLPSPDSP